MALFPVAETEGTVQVNDKTRLSAVKSFISKDESALTSVEIDPDGSGFISVFDSNSKNWFLDYQYATDGDKTVTVRVDNGSGSPVTASTTLTVVTVADDKLFSSDTDLIKHEPDILDPRNLPAGRNSFLNVHRRAQEIIIAWFDERGVVDTDGNKITKADVIDIEEVKQWSIYLVLRLIFEGLSNAVDDIFHEKANRYQSLETRAKDRAFFRLDLNNDGELDTSEGINVRSSDMVRV